MPLVMTVMMGRMKITKIITIMRREMQNFIGLLISLLQCAGF
jgi:hypothetical protein